MNPQQAMVALTEAIQGAWQADGRDLDAALVVWAKGLNGSSGAVLLAVERALRECEDGLGALARYEGVSLADRTPEDSVAEADAGEISDSLGLGLVRRYGLLEAARLITEECDPQIAQMDADEDGTVEETTTMANVGSSEGSMGVGSVWAGRKRRKRKGVVRESVPNQAEAEAAEAGIEKVTGWKHKVWGTDREEYLEVLKNPTYSEMKSVLKSQEFGDEIGGLLTAANLYVFRRDLAFHRAVGDRLGLKEYIGLMIVPGGGKWYVTVTDATTKAYKHKGFVADMIERVFGDDVTIWYYDEDIVGDWRELVTESEWIDLEETALAEAETQDAAYLAAVERGDTEAALAMVDAAAVAAGYTIGPLWHGGTFDAKQGDTSFAPWTHFGTENAAQERVGGSGVADSVYNSIEVGQIENKNDEDNGKWYYEVYGVWSEEVYDTEDAARDAANVEADEIVNNGQLDPVGESFTRVFIRGKYLRMPDLVKWGIASVFDAVQKKIEVRPTMRWQIREKIKHGQDDEARELIASVLSEAGYAGIVYLNAVEHKGSDSYIVLARENVKLADVAYDDAGELIPPSKRFNLGSVDIREEIELPDEPERYTLRGDGVVVDRLTTLQWRIGPDEDTSYDEAVKWIASLGVGWRMPVWGEVRSLWHPGMGDNNLPDVIDTSGLFVWAGGREKDTNLAWCFSLEDGRQVWRRGKKFYGFRVFAVLGQNREPVYVPPSKDELLALDESTWSELRRTMVRGLGSENLLWHWYELGYKYDLVRRFGTGMPQRTERMLEWLGEELIGASREVASRILPGFEDYLAHHNLDDKDALAKMWLGQWEGQGVESPMEGFRNIYRIWGGDPEGIVFDEHGIEQMPYLKAWLELNRKENEMQWEEDRGKGIVGEDEENPYTDMSLADIWQATLGDFGDEFYALFEDWPDAEWIAIELLKMRAIPAWLRKFPLIPYLYEDNKKHADNLLSLVAGLETTPTKAKEEVNVALNAAHNSGSILEYVQTFDEEITPELLTALSEADTAEWNDDLRYGPGVPLPDSYESVVSAEEWREVNESVLLTEADIEYVLGWKPDADNLKLNLEHWYELVYKLQIVKQQPSKDHPKWSAHHARELGKQVIVFSQSIARMLLPVFEEWVDMRRGEESGREGPPVKDLSQKDEWEKFKKIATNQPVFNGVGDAISEAEKVWRKHQEAIARWDLKWREFLDGRFIKQANDVMNAGEPADAVGLLQREQLSGMMPIDEETFIQDKASYWFGSPHDYGRWVDAYLGSEWNEATIGELHAIFDRAVWPALVTANRMDKVLRRGGENDPRWVRYKEVRQRRDELKDASEGNVKGVKRFVEIVNLALNQAHRDGRMMEYIENHYRGVSEEFLDKLSNQSVRIWNREMGKEGIIEPSVEYDPPSPDRFTKTKDGVIQDRETGLEWLVGPDFDTDYAGAEAWIASLSGVSGGGWRMPTVVELRTLYQQDVGSRNMDPVFMTTGWWVWGEPRDASSAWGFSFYDDVEDWDHRDDSYNRRVFAARPRR